MSKIKEEVINEIRQKADIVSVIGQYLPLNKKGRNYTAICPFHDDHHPSLSISTDKQIYKCFVCGAGGNVFTFVSAFEKIPFIQAVAKVGSLVQIEVEVDTTSQTSVDPNKQKLHKVLQDTIAFTTYQLHAADGFSIKQYLVSRGIDDALAAKFQIGYNPPNHATTTFLLAKKHQMQDLIDANVSYQYNNQLIDVFENRITFPIFDQYNHPVGFSARSIDDNQKAKYINTASTLLYNKSEILYNIHQAKDAIRMAGYVIVVEGVMDVIAFAKANIYHVVATLGTALSKEQMAMLKRLSMHVVLGYDFDDAGQRATYKAISALISQGLIVEVIPYPNEDDPDELINKSGKEALHQVLKQRYHWMEFNLFYGQKLYNLDNYQQKKTYIQTMIGFIQQCRDPLDQKHFANSCATITNMDADQILQLVQAQTPKKEIKQQKVKQNQFDVYPFECEILAQMLLSKQATYLFAADLGFLIHPLAHRLALLLIELYQSKDQWEVADILSLIEDEQLQQFTLWILDWPLFPQSINQQVLQDAIKSTKIKMIENRLLSYKKMSNQTTSPTKKADYINKMIEAQREIAQLIDQKEKKSENI